jgi:hypothetical protein
MKDLREKISPFTMMLGMIPAELRYYNVCCGLWSGEYLCDSGEKYGILKRDLENSSRDWIFVLSDYLISQYQLGMLTKCSLHVFVTK